MPILIHGSSKIPALQQKQIKPSTTQQNVTPDSGYDGLSKVIISPISLQEKSITPTESQQIVTPDDGYDGISKVAIAAAQSTSSGINKIEFTPDEITYESGYTDGKDFIVFDIGASSINGFSIIYKGYPYNSSAGNYFSNVSNSCLFSVVAPSDTMSHNNCFSAVPRSYSGRFGAFYGYLANIAPMNGAFLQQRCRKLPFPEKLQKIFRRAVLIFLLPKCTRHRRELWQNAKKKSSGTLPFGSVPLLSSSMFSPVQPNVYARHTAARLRHIYKTI